MVSAQSPLDAVRQALTGVVVVGGNTYTFTPATLSDDPVAHAPFLLVPVGDGYEVRLEDLAGSPQTSDWDYNDTVWKVGLTQYNSDTPTPVVAVADPDSPFLADPPKPAPPPKTAADAPFRVTNEALAMVNKGKLTARLQPGPNATPTVSDTLQIAVTNGHIDGALTNVTQEVTIGKGSMAERKVTVTLTAKRVENQIDATKNAYEVIYEGTLSKVDAFPGTATPDEKTKYPLVTKVVPTDVGTTTKTNFPTDWKQSDITAAVLSAATAKRTADAKAGNPWGAKNGTFDGTGNGVKIEIKWVLKDEVVEITHIVPKK